MRDTVGLARDLETAPLGVGAWAWGTKRLWGYGGVYGRREVEEAFRDSVAAGVTFVDTAELYGNGESERIIGEILRSGGLEKRPVIATKFAPFPYRFDPRSLLSALDRSLARLGVPRIDLYQVHWYSPVPRPSGLMDALAEAVKEGKVHRVGVSNYGADAMRRAYERLAAHGVQLASNQVEYNLLNRKPETNGVLDACRELGVSLIAYSPLAQGLLTGKYGPGARPSGLARRMSRALGEGNLKRIEPIVNLLRETGEVYNKQPAQVALNWLVLQGTLPIPGAKNGDQARQNAGSLGWTLAGEDLERLNLATLGWR